MAAYIKVVFFYFRLCGVSWSVHSTKLGFGTPGRQPLLADSSEQVDAEVFAAQVSQSQVSLLSVHLDPFFAGPGHAKRITEQGSGKHRKAKASWPCAEELPGKMLTRGGEGAPESVAMGTMEGTTQLIKIPSSMRG